MSAMKLVKRIEMNAAIKQQRNRYRAGAWIAIAALVSCTSLADAASRLGGDSIALSTPSIVSALAAPNIAATLASTPQGLALSAGQVSTLPPSGNFFLSDGALGRAAISSLLLVFNPSTGRVVPLSAQVPHSAHTATLLPGGTVLVHRAGDAHGAAVAQSEIFDPASGQSTLLGTIGLLASAHHAATVLSDGGVLVTGGSDQRGAAVLSAEISNPLTLRIDSSDADIDMACLDDTATLLPSGAVLVSRGTNAGEKPLATNSLYDPTAQSFSNVSAAAAQGLAASLVVASVSQMVTTSLPAVKAADVDVCAQLMVRFSTRLDVATLSTAMVTLIGPGGATPLKAVGVNSDVLLFVTAVQQLLPASQYKLFVRGAQDNAKRVLPLFSVGFTTQTIQAVSSSNGMSVAGASSTRAQTAGGGAVTHTKLELSRIDEEWIPEERHRHGAWMSHRAYSAQSSLPQQPQLRQLIQSRTPMVPDSIALVTAQAVTEQTPRVQRASWSEFDAQAQALNAKETVQSLSAANGVTVLAAQVLRLNGLPLAHVSMQVGTVSTFTDANGELLLSGIALDSQVITINAATAERPDATYRRFQHLFNVAAGKTNLLPLTT